MEKERKKKWPRKRRKNIRSFINLHEELTKVAIEARFCFWNWTTIKKNHFSFIVSSHCHRVALHVLLFWQSTVTLFHFFWCDSLSGSLFFPLITYRYYSFLFQPVHFIWEFSGFLVKQGSFNFLLTTFTTSLLFSFQPIFAGPFTAVSYAHPDVSFFKKKL